MSKQADFSKNGLRTRINTPWQFVFTDDFIPRAARTITVTTGADAAGTSGEEISRSPPRGEERVGKSSRTLEQKKG